jgi:hypothetical protein
MCDSDVTHQQTLKYTGTLLSDILSHGTTRTYSMIQCTYHMYVHEPCTARSVIQFQIYICILMPSKILQNPCFRKFSLFSPLVLSL